MFTIIGAMAELESSLISERVTAISERVTAGMAAAKSRGKHVGRPQTPPWFTGRIEELARTTAMSVRQIHTQLEGQVGRGVVGTIVKEARRDGHPAEA